ncbi:MAG: MASE1 domain-containing protein [Hyphomicrobiaceae bacterium]
MSRDPAVVASAADRSRLAQLQLLVAMAVVYYVGCHVGLVLRTQPEGIGVFWPAAGIAAGTLLALGSGATVPVAAGVALGCLIASLQGRDDPRLAVIFTVCNTCEGLCVAALVRFAFGERFDLDTVKQVIGLFGAALLGAGLTAVPAVLALRYVAAGHAGLLDLWLTWTRSDAIGILAVAPFIITLPALVRQPPPLGRLAEGFGLLVILAAAAYYLFGPFSATEVGRLVPLGSLLFPILLWITARGPPTFGAAAAAIVCMVIVTCMVNGIGSLGDPRLTLQDRVGGAQLIMLVATLCALSLAALFAEQRQTATVLIAVNQELLSMSATLEKRVEERSQDLARESEDRLAAEMKLVDYRNELAHVQRVATAGELATFIAHELNQPLAAISTTAAACVRLDRAGRLSENQLAHHLGDISSQAQRASGIIKQLHRLVRKEAPDLEPIDLARVVDDTLPLVRSLARRGDIDIEFQRQFSLPRIEGNAIQLGQLVLNLLRNAIEAVTPLPFERRRVRIATEPNGDRVVLIVEDCGPGFSATAKARLFGRVYSEKPDGLGMGLRICETIAAAHGAKLEIESGDSVPMGGTRVRIAFPIQPTVAEAT